MDFIKQFTPYVWNLRSVPILFEQIYSNLASCICALHTIFCIVSRFSVRSTLYAQLLWNPPLVYRHWLYFKPAKPPPIKDIYQYIWHSYEEGYFVESTNGDKNQSRKMLCQSDLKKIQSPSVNQTVWNSIGNFSGHNFLRFTNGKISHLVFNHSKTGPVFRPQYIGKADWQFENCVRLSGIQMPFEYRTFWPFFWPICVRFWNG